MWRRCPLATMLACMNVSCQLFMPLHSAVSSAISGSTTARSASHSTKLRRDQRPRQPGATARPVGRPCLLARSGRQTWQTGNGHGPCAQARVRPVLAQLWSVVSRDCRAPPLGGGAARDGPEAVVPRCMLRVVCGMLYDAPCMLPVACYTLHVARCVLHVACCTLHAVCCDSRARCGIHFSGTNDTRGAGAAARGVQPRRGSGGRAAASGGYRVANGNGLRPIGAQLPTVPARRP